VYKACELAVPRWLQLVRSQTEKFPRLHWSHSPQMIVKGTTTRSPILLAAETQKPRRQRSGCGAARDGFGISLTAGGINFVVTTLRTRCPGMSINRFPIVIWGTLRAKRPACSLYRR
jgi:hypothetical protein